MKDSILIVMFFVNCFVAHAQWQDSFTDSDFSTSPEWIGDVAKFNIDASRLHLNDGVAGTANLFTTSDIINDAQWDFKVEFAFNPSSSNYANVYLVSDNIDVSQGQGYFLKIGNSTDNISLYRFDTGNNTLLISSIEGRLNTTTVNVDIRVTRSMDGSWQVFSLLPTDVDYVLEGTVIDQNINSSSFFGIECVYTSTRSTKFYFDDFVVAGLPYVDNIAPVLDSAIIHKNDVTLYFDEALNTSIGVEGFKLNGVFPDIVSFLNESSIILTFASGVDLVNTLIVNGMMDLSGNVSLPISQELLFIDNAPIVWNDIVINELLPDPTPRVDLPEAEYVELLNNTDRLINLKNWQLTDAVSAASLPEYILFPDSTVLLTSSINGAAFTNYGSTLGLSNWPSLNNSGDIIKLKNPFDEIIDSVAYEKSWYQNDEKSDGGWSLELITPAYNCAGASNWKASTDVTGGTPGKRNSQFQSTDILNPSIQKFEINRDSIYVLFSEPVHENINETEIIINPVVGFSLLKQEGSAFIIKLDSALLTDGNYNIAITKYEDCSNNIMIPFDTTVYIDISVPFIDTIYNYHENILEIVFSESIQSVDTSNFSINGSGYPKTLIHNIDKPNQISLFFDQDINIGETNIQYGGVIDLNGNIVQAGEFIFEYNKPYTPNHRDILFTEIMADPSPVVALPESEYLEIINNTSETISLIGLILSDSKSNTIINDGYLLPGEYAILCPNSKIEAFKQFGKVIGITNWPSLNNTDETIVLSDKNGSVIDSVTYSKSWYGDDNKTDGGWSLEVLVLGHPCSSANNWLGSTSSSGGSPGEKNSQYLPHDTQSPEVLSFNVVYDSIFIQFTEPISNQVIESGIVSNPSGIVEIKEQSETSIKAVLNKSEFKDGIYNFSVSNYKDCVGNIMIPFDTTIYVDINTPKIDTVFSNHNNILEVVFSEPIRPVITSNFFITGVGTPSSIANHSSSSNHVSLIFDQKLNIGELELQYDDIEDLFGNTTYNQLVSFVYSPSYLPQFGDIIITEIMADPSPVVALPESEYLEIFNRTDKDISLIRLSIGDTKSKTTITDGIILPGEYIILCPNSKTEAFASFGKVIGVSNWPSLNSTDETVVISNSDNEVIHSVSYTKSWYNDNQKEEGGWSLELKNTNYYCLQNKVWSASENPLGGTPGKANGNQENVTPFQSLDIVSVDVVTKDSILIQLSQAIPPQQIVSKFFPAIEIEHLELLKPNQEILSLKVATPLNASQPYLLEIEPLENCMGVSTKLSTEIILADSAINGDILINEVLFNASNNNAEFIELFNQSDKYLNPNDLILSTSSGSIQLHKELPLIAPKTYYTLAKDRAFLLNYYTSAVENAVYEIGFSTLNNSEGTVSIHNMNHILIDSIYYSNNMHFDLLDDIQNVSLERISFEKLSLDTDNWKSAASTVGYATPGYENSQYFFLTEKLLGISVSPEIIVPNNNGQDDFASIYYQFDKSGYIANIQVLDVTGRNVKTLASNSYLSLNGTFIWDGTNYEGKKVNIGHYIIYSVVINEDGTKQQYKNKVVIGW